MRALGRPNLVITRSPRPNRSKGQPYVVSATGLSTRRNAMQATFLRKPRRSSRLSAENPHPEQKHSPETSDMVKNGYGGRSTGTSAVSRIADDFGAPRKSVCSARTRFPDAACSELTSWPNRYLLNRRLLWPYVPPRHARSASPPAQAHRVGESQDRLVHRQA